MDAERRRLVEAHVNFARKYARKRRMATDDLADVTSDALFGLVLAVRRYQPDRGSFAACARVAMEAAIRRGRQVRSGISRKLWEVDPGDCPDWALALINEYGRPWSLLSLNARVDPDDDVEFGDLLEDPGRDIDRATDKLGVSQAMTELSDRERVVLELRYQRELSQLDVAARIGCSQMQVSRIERAALGRLRAVLEREAA